MSTILQAGEFKAKCLHVLDEVHQTRCEVVITKRGKAVARLVPMDDPAPVLFGRMKGTVTISGDIVASTGEAWEAEK